MARTYWIDLFTVETWKEFQDHGSDVSGFREKRWKTVQRMKPGDYLLCYLVKVSRWVGVLEVVGESYIDEEPIWSGAVYPSRVHVRPVLQMAPECGVPVLDMRDKLTVFRGLDNPNRWQGPFRGSPNEWKATDGEAIVQALNEAEANPVKRPLGRLGRSAAKAATQPPLTVGDVVIPEDEPEVPEEAEREGRAHTEIQYLLLKLGADMGFGVHVANNDQGQVWNGQRLGDMPGRRKHLPRQFDPAVNRTIELIDVLWLEGNAITAAFEIESTTSIYSGLLRMSDLLAQQPNMAIPLFLVAPEERRKKVVEQVNRPTFASMNQPVAEVGRYIPFEGFREALKAAQDFVSFLKPDWLQKISESCALEDV
jgi:predicted RNA-binding protein